MVAISYNAIYVFVRTSLSGSCSTVNDIPNCEVGDRKDDSAGMLYNICMCMHIPSMAYINQLY